MKFVKKYRTKSASRHHKYSLKRSNRPNYAQKRYIRHHKSSMKRHSRSRY